jgi:hypothetical protein
LKQKRVRSRKLKSFLKSALPLAQAETGTTSWYALKIGAAKFGIFDTFADANGRDATFLVRLPKPCSQRLR